MGNSTVGGSEHPTKSSMQLLILCQINLKKSHDEDNVVEIDPNYNKILWLPSSHSPVEQIGVYLSDRHGNPLPFMHCNIIRMYVHSTHQIFKMVSVEKWKKHFQRQAHRTFPKEQTYIVNQTRCRLGCNAYSRYAMYQV